MASNRLQLNPAKTELTWLASSRRLHRCQSDALLVSGVWIQPSKKVQNLGVIIDSDVSGFAHQSRDEPLLLPHSITEARPTITRAGYGRDPLAVIHS